MRGLKDLTLTLDTEITDQSLDLDEADHECTATDMLKVSRTCVASPSQDNGVSLKRTLLPSCNIMRPAFAI
jgi:hypothetical protein